MEIRPMTIADYDEVFAMWQITSKRALSQADEKSQIERYLSRNSGMSQVAVIDGKIVGTVLEKAVEKIAADGIDKTHIFCYQTNEAGQKFWSDFGFEKRDDVFVFSFNNKEK